MLYDIAARVMQWAEEPGASPPTVRRLVHRLRQAVSDNPIAFPHNQERSLPPLPATSNSHKVLRPTDAQFRGRAVAAQPPQLQRAPTPLPAPHQLPLRIRQLTQTWAATDAAPFRP